MKSALSVALCLSAGTVSLGASAQSLPLDLSWQAPEECPSGASIRSDLARITRPRAGRELSPLNARVVIARVASGYRLALETEREGALNHAQVDGKTCESLARAATLMLALAYGDGVELLSNDEPAVAGTPEPSVSATNHEPKASAPTVSEPAPSAQSSIRIKGAKLEVAPWVAAMASSGLVASTALGLEVGLDLGATHWLTVLRVRGIPSTESARKGAISVRLSSTSLALGGCAQLPLGALRLAGCASVSAGVLHASSRGARRDGSASPELFALTPSLLARYRVAPHCALRLELGAQVPLSRPELVVEGEGVLYRASRVVPELGAGIELAF